MRLLPLLAIAVVLVGGNALGQATTNLSLTTAPTTMPAPAAGADEKAWSLSLSAYTYIVPHGRDYVQPTVTLDHDWLHLEARYNYEALDTASVWVGYNFSGGEKFPWEFTPIVGGVFGDTSGIAAGYKGSISWWKLSLYSEGEYLYDTNVSSDSYFYNWTEFTLAPVDWFRFGLVGQRTRAYDTDRDIQRGLLVGLTWKNIDLAAYVLNPDEDEPAYAFSFGISF